MQKAYQIAEILHVWKMQVSKYIKIGQFLFAQ